METNHRRIPNLRSQIRRSASQDQHPKACCSRGRESMEPLPERKRALTALPPGPFQPIPRNPKARCKDFPIQPIQTHPRVRPASRLDQPAGPDMPAKYIPKDKFKSHLNRPDRSARRLSGPRIAAPKSTPFRLPNFKPTRGLAVHSADPWWPHISEDIETTSVQTAFPRDMRPRLARRPGFPQGVPCLRSGCYADQFVTRRLRVDRVATHQP